MGGSPTGSVCPKCGTSRFNGWCDCPRPAQASRSLREEIEAAFQQAAQQNYQMYKIDLNPIELRMLEEMNRLAKYAGLTQYQHSLQQVQDPNTPYEPHTVQQNLYKRDPFKLPPAPPLQTPVKECQYCGVEYLAGEKAPCDCKKSLMAKCGKCGEKVLRGKTCECRKKPDPETCEHEWGGNVDACVKCGITGLDFVQRGRKP